MPPCVLQKGSHAVQETYCNKKHETRFTLDFMFDTGSFHANFNIATLDLTSRTPYAQASVLQLNFRHCIADHDLPKIGFYNGNQAK